MYIWYGIKKTKGTGRYRKFQFGDIVRTDRTLRHTILVGLAYAPRTSEFGYRLWVITVLKTTALKLISIARTTFLLKLQRAALHNTETNNAHIDSGSWLL